MKKSNQGFSITLGDLFFQEKSVFSKEIEAEYDSFLKEKKEKEKRLMIAQRMSESFHRKSSARRDY